ncbi:hypothetical protein [Alicyclobacillus dauci]|uniref:Anti-sigma-28 factor, FlgM family n=1 Tax=Alicyclobacillus dauci TaxID=1475485 RepID=A0ABY6Z585_9BACL|nr:hypothetical protein [Alicyclobacillus dauci]WAH37683.1 hypothetical protein NZD86_04000 [Alicyclobacillus dauci]
MNVSDSIQGKGGAYPYQQGNQNVRNDGEPATTPAVDLSKSARLDALKARMQSGEPINLNRLADSMLKKGAFIDVQA